MTDLLAFGVFAGVVCLAVVREPHALKYIPGFPAPSVLPPRSLVLRAHRQTLQLHQRCLS